MNEISTKLYRINFKYLLENVLDRAMWKKSWTVYDYDNCRIDLRLSSIDVTGETVMLRIYSNRKRHWFSTDTNSTSVSLPLAQDHFNELVFYQKVFSAIESVLQGEERDFIRDTPPYETAKRLEDETDEKNTETAKQICIDRGLYEEEDKDIIEAYVDKYVSDKQVYFTSELLERMKYVTHSQRYLMLAYQFEKNCKNHSSMLLERVNDKFADDSLEDIQKVVQKALELVEENEMENLKDAMDQILEEESEEEDEETDN